MPTKRQALSRRSGLERQLWGLKGQSLFGQGQPLEFFLAVPCRRYGEFSELLQPLHAAAAPEGEMVAETSWEGLRLVVAHNPQRAQEQTDKRTARIAAL
jgi:hypothetical protein